MLEQNSFCFAASNRYFNDAHVRRDNTPAIFQSCPGLTLAPTALRVAAIELGVGGGEVVAEGGNHGVAQFARKADWRTRRAKGADRFDAVETFAAAETQHAGVGPELEPPET